MGESKGPIVCHLTQAEQVLLGIALSRVPATNREERAKKARAFADPEDGGLGLEWVKDALEDPPERRVSSVELLNVFENSRDAGASALDAMGEVIKATMKAIDPFAGKHSKEPIKIVAQRDTVAWMLEALDKMPVQRNQQQEAIGTAEDFVFARIEERFGRARQGDYKLPESLQEAPAAAAKKAKPKAT